MKRALAIGSATVALAAALLAVTAAPASATPNKTIGCSNCHKHSTAVKVAVTRVSATSTTVTYKVRVSGGSGATGWAVFANGRNVAHKVASTGTFKVAKGKSLRVWGVKTGSGSNYKALTAK